MFTHQISISIGEPNSAPIVQQVNISADGKINEGDITVPASSTDLLINQSIDISALKSLYLLSTKDMILQTNSSAEPDDSLNLVANVPLVWFEGCGFDNPFTVDVTALYATTGDVGEAALTMRGLMDLTP